MESDKSDENEHEAISKQIVDYYKKYSQSKQLPKYFSGTSLSYMPRIVKDDEITTPIIVIEDTTRHTLISKQTETSADFEEPAKIISPASSVTSNRKLEWDNGADIGYNNCEKNKKLQKSLSLPILISSTDDKIKDKSVKTKLSSQIVTIISYSSHSDDNLVDKPVQSSSSSSSYPIEAPIESSSSSSQINHKKPVSSSSSSSFSNTLAYLKSKIGTPDAESTPNCYETPCTPKLKKRDSNKKVINLCITKPILIECFGGKIKTGLDKRIQTSFIGGLSKSIQTDATIEDKPTPIKQIQKPIDNQSVIVVNYDTSSDKRTCSSNTQTDSEIIASNCDSFEYYDQKNNGVDSLKRSAAQSDLAASTDSSKEIPLLGQLILKKQSNSLVGDIDRSIEILQKLLKSKKYDAATKKRYIKKIVDKIVDNKYNEDSTTSSELFVPKKQEQQKLQENIPWYPPQLSKFTVKTFSDEFLPSENRNESKTKSIFTMNERQGTIDNQSSSEKHQNSSSGSFQSWKDDKTLSERLLEDKQKGQGDHLVKFAMKERENQLDWINDEISHLTKLRGLLEKQRTTTVYMVSEHSDKCTRSSCSCCNFQKSSGRNYVIETEFSPTSSSGVTDFNLYDGTGKKNYHVSQVVKRAEGVETNGKVVGDIKVVSDERTTNIQVTARKTNGKPVGESFKPKEPVLVGTGKYDTFPRSRAEEERCWPCGMIKSRRDATAVTGGLQQYSFDVAVKENPSSFIKKVEEILSKYGSKPSSGASDCKCKEDVNAGGETYRKVSIKDVQCVAGCRYSEKEHLAQQTEYICSENAKIQTDSEKACQCGIKDNQLQTECICLENAKIQTDIEEVSREKGCQCGTKDDQFQTECICLDNAQVQTKDLVFNHKEIQTSINTRSSTSSSESSSSESETATTSTCTGSVKSCLCCKRKNVTAKNLYDLRKKLSCKAYPLCRPCYRQNQRCSYSPTMYNNPTHMCNCYTVVETKTLNDIKKTITDLNDLDNQFCSCTNVKNRHNSDYCKYCNCKLRKTSRNRNGIAYVLTFENESPKKEEKKKKKRQPYLEEIKIKIPSYKKKHKDKENRRKKESRSHTGESEGNSSSGRSQKRAVFSLEEYLQQNRPDFVETAEGRRRTVVDSKMRREEMTDRNKLAFLQNYLDNKDEKNPKRIFSSKEMKEITRKNYQKLPEVQQKLVSTRERKIRQANRIMADTFNKKLRENVLKGKMTLPTDVNVVNL